jgi:hypothetical protein
LDSQAPRLSEEVNEKLYRQVDLTPLLEKPHDYLGSCVAIGKSKGWNPTSFYPTPHPVVECLVRLLLADYFQQQPRNLLYALPPPARRSAAHFVGSAASAQREPASPWRTSQELDRHRHRRHHRRSGERCHQAASWPCSALHDHPALSADPWHDDRDSRWERDGVRGWDNQDRGWNREQQEVSARSTFMQVGGSQANNQALRRDYRIIWFTPSGTGILHQFGGRSGVILMSESTTSALQRWIDGMNAGDPSAQEALIGHAYQRLRALTRKLLSDFRRLERWEDVLGAVWK